MYSRYNRLQKAQLHAQVYEDTQKTKIIVYAPNRCSLLKSALSYQLHGNYCLHTSIEEVKNEEGEGVLMLGEDAELMSVALMHYAKAISEGNDFVFSDELFGVHGETQCFWSQYSDTKCCDVVVVSKKLFLQVADKTDDVHQLISMAMQKAQNKKYIPYALASHRRQLQSIDVFSKNRKQVLVLCHEFSLTGAPIVLVSAMQLLKSLGFDVLVLGPEYGAAIQLFLDAGVTVITNEKRLKDDSLYGLAIGCDLVIANTVVESDSVKMLGDSPVPVLWWLHDAFLGYPFIEDRIPIKQEDNVKICSVGKHAMAAMHSVRPEFKIEQLLYGLSDYAKDQFQNRDFGVEAGKVFFTTVGSFETRKGQNILAKAISLLASEEMEKAVFLFVGKVLEQYVYDEVKTLIEKYPNNVLYIERLTRDEIKSLMCQCSCVICSSTDDPMPTFVTEAAMFGKSAIVSEHTGTAGLITHGKDGFIYHNDDPEELCERIREVIKNPEMLVKMKDDCRALYENNFTQEVFEDVLGTYIKEMC